MESKSKFDSLVSYLPDDYTSVLDVGGGRGVLNQSLKKVKPNCDYTLVERSIEACADAESKGLRVNNLDVTRSALPFADNSFDLVVASDFLEHVENPWTVLAEMTRVSRRYVVIYGPNFASLACRWDAVRGRPIRQMALDKNGRVAREDDQLVSHIRYITFNNIMFWSEKLGLVLVKSRAYWFRRYFLIRWFAEPLLKNWAESYQLVFKKPVDYKLPAESEFKTFVN